MRSAKFGGAFRLYVKRNRQQIVEIFWVLRCNWSVLYLADTCPILPQLSAEMSEFELI